MTEESRNIFLGPRFDVAWGLVAGFLRRTAASEGEVIKRMLWPCDTEARC
jgi:hypothetical protein